MPPPAQTPVAVANERSDLPAVEKDSPAPASPPTKDMRQVAAPSAPKETSRGLFVGSLRIHSTPSGARVVIDGKAAGVTPLIVANLTAGSHAVRIEAEGHTPWSSAIRVIADRQTNVNTTLDTISLLP
jgi:PEGA domain